MAKTMFLCSECGWTTPKWVGRCGGCQSWGTMAETGGVTQSRTRAVRPSSAAQPIAEVDANTAQALGTGVDELDRVLGGGIVPGAVVLLSGEPGVGKSTLLLDVAARFARTGRKVLYVSGEESAGQIRLRAQRIGALADLLYLSAETDLGTVLGMIEAEQPELLIVDSVQTLASADVEGVPGGVTQVREVAAGIIRAAKSKGVATLLVGHVTKDGQVAGPRLLEHLVDVVCSFEGEKHSRLRTLRAVKNRFGPTDEFGCFDMTENGIIGLADPSGLFLSATEDPSPGTFLGVTQEGRRPMVVEVQALLTPPASGPPRRAVSGVENARTAMILAVLNKHVGLDILGKDVFAATLGGAKAVEPAFDLALCLALVSGLSGKPPRRRTVAIGEISLSGEIRTVPGIESRLSEAFRQGVTHAIVPRGAMEGTRKPRGMAVREAQRLQDAINSGVLSDTAPPVSLDSNHA
ncbi:DNA repair protein RadA [Sediminivirga luteola]|uniref:DNA repair protein RadA n=1 Tax=Sediminivirga luteola TaxID=1774748 RepID=UPI001F5909A5|nr:DNA repair protein RadA [Sediminivirga luteola]MCI2264756.1 DNA repair protein RadA [Sediminivirga luteola]